MFRRKWRIYPGREEPCVSFASCCYWRCWRPQRPSPGEVAPGCQELKNLEEAEAPIHSRWEASPAFGCCPSGKVPVCPAEPGEGKLPLQPPVEAAKGPLSAFQLHLARGACHRAPPPDPLPRDRTRAPHS